MHVTQSIESNINILAQTSTAEQITASLHDMPFDLYICQNVTDIFMIPSFIQFVDGSILSSDKQDIDVWECYLTDWTGRMKKCRRCKNYFVCAKSNDVPPELMDMGPDYNAPAILLHADKRQREVEGLKSLLPPMPVYDIFSTELKDWIKLTCLSWHKKALRWRKEFDQWRAVRNLKDSRKPKTYREIADEKWMPRRISVELRVPDFE